MYIGVVGPIATSDLLSASAQQQYSQCPKGRAGAPLISNLIKEYMSRGHRVLAITIDPAMDDEATPYVCVDGLLTYVVAPSRQRIFRLNGKRPGRTADFYRFERQHMLAMLRQYKPEVVHAHWTYEFALAALDYNPNALITVHDNARTILTYIRTLERVFMLLLARYVCSRGRWFTAVSPYMAKSIGRWIASDVHVVGNPITIPEATPRLTLPAKPIICIVVNGWEKRKNTGQALLAFDVLQKQNPDAVLWVIGNIAEPNGEAETFCHQHNITTSNIRFWGSLPYAEVLEKVAQSTLVLHTSLEESFGMVLAEAMSYGVPVVAGKYSGAVPWVVQEGGLLVDVTRVGDIVAAMERLLADPALYAQLSTNAIAAIRTRFSIETIAGQYLDLYQQCASYRVDSDMTRTASSDTSAYLA